MIFFGFLLFVFDVELFIGGGLLLVLFVCSALISGSEIAYFSLSSKEKNSLQAGDSVSSRAVLRLLGISERLLATILIVNSFINIGIVFLSIYLTDTIFDFGNSYALKVVADIAIITFLIVLFGEIIPRIYARLHALKFSRFMSIPLSLLELVFRPLSMLYVFLNKRVTKRIEKKTEISLDELSQAIEIAADESNEEKEMLEGIVRFSNTKVREVMKSRVEVVAVDLTTSFPKLKTVIINSGFSRIPVCDKDFDEIKGILYIKDLLPHLHKSDTFKWQTLLRAPFFVPESKKTSDLLKDFQTKKMHMGIVIDEYGGASGIITLEDILEEIVGEISDETDEKEAWYEINKAADYVFKGETPLPYFCEVLGLDLRAITTSETEAATLSEYILINSGKLPEKNEEIKLNGLRIKIRATDKRRIKKLVVKKKKTDNFINRF